MSSHPEDQEILNWFAQGGSQKERGFTALVAKYGDSLYRQIRVIAKNHEYTNDILQNVLIKVYQKLSGFNQDSSLYTWLYRIARNESLNFLSKEKRRSGIDLDEPILEIKAGHALLDNQSAEYIESLLMSAIDELPEKQAIVFRMKYFEELKYSEMSLRLQTSEGALKASFHHAKQKIEEFVLNRLNQSIS